MKKLKFLIYPAILVFVSCGVAESEEEAASVALINPLSSPLYIEVLKKYEKNENTTYAGSCKFETTDAIGSTKTCTIKIPELELYYSDLVFRVGSSMGAECEFVEFSPFYFRYSTANGYFPEGTGGADDDIECADPSETKCYGGAAPDILGAKFPASKSHYFLLANGEVSEFNLKSSNKRRLAGGAGQQINRSLITNANVASNLAPGSRGVALTFGGGDPVDYVANSFVDYTASCRDKWANPLYHITLIISDEDVTPEPYDDAVDFFWDWLDPF